MKPASRHPIPLLATAVILAGCATSPPPDPLAQVPYCHKTNKGRVVSCTSGPAPSLNADAEAKRFASDRSALTVYVVRHNWSDARNSVKIYPDGGPAIETLPETMVRLSFEPGAHTIAFDFEGQRQSIGVEGKAGDVRFVRIDGMVWSWKSSYAWANEPEAAIRERALKSRLVAQVAVR